ncbi:Gfo/Idh/MocA family oxidoreductase [Oscillochloris sp. ZM17-4]|uniref:Gfo/Idh/MocA family protein n=1 Tax=Oscillochloris sp. ZM17-4 TaxID=2866714 RepID=UPI001C735ACE|nr:Gfo/Idh/MocA family oxidoreductase [Oscillochloris sp. ZM17-4]MBX0331150.1 Gfo/Idh/MocA family oxidoreductase [Oscillochloris sp. ZM17-4]
MQPVRLGVIGLGLIWARVHEAILATMGDAFVPVALCDISPQRRAAAAERYPDAAIVDDYQQLLALPQVDAALVLTPLGLNAPVAAAALRAGKHVIMEKPIARSSAEGRALAELARGAGRTLCVAEQMGYRRAEEVVAETIGSGVIGDLVTWDWVQHVEGDRAEGALRYDSTPWRRDADFPLGTMFDGGVHMIAGLSRIFGAPEAVMATGQKLRPGYGAYDHVSAIFQYAGGVTGTLSYSGYLQPLANHRRIYGTAGAIAVEQDQLLIVRPGEPERSIDLPEENAYLAMWRGLRRAFIERAGPAYTPEMALRDVAILEAVAAAISGGGRARVAL